MNFTCIILFYWKENHGIVGIFSSFGGNCSYGDLYSDFLTIAIYVISNNVIYTNTLFFRGKWVTATNYFI